MDKTLLSVIVPCYNEAESLPLFFAELKKIENQIAAVYNFEYLFINDGSVDETLEILRDLQKENSETVHYISFSRNFGKEAAIYAGLENSKGGLVTLMDADLQDPPGLLLQMLEKMEVEEVDSVVARRVDRSGEPFILTVFSKLFYWLMNKMSTTPVISGVRDFRLMTRQVVEAVLQMTEYQRFSKGLFSWVGFETAYVGYHNSPRAAGKTKWKMVNKVNYAIEGFVNFSDAPLNFAVYLGFFAILADIAAILFIIVRRLLYSDPVSGWASTIVIILFTFGLTLMMLGIIGKYIAKIFFEVKGRPIYLVKEKK